MLVQPPLVSRPLRLATVLFAGMVTLFAAGAPFVTGVDTVLFLGAGSAYCLFLALLGVGLALACRERAYWWWILSRTVLPMLVAMAGIWLLLPPDPETFFQVPSALRGLQVVIGAWLAVGLMVAEFGWVQYARWWSASASDHGPGNQVSARRNSEADERRQL